MGKADQVAVMIFTEFGRRVEENGSLGTDHGTATPMFIVGKGVQGGFYSKHPSLTDLDDGNMKMTTDFRRVYATMIKEWLGYDDVAAVLKGNFEPLGVFATMRVSAPWTRGTKSQNQGLFFFVFSCLRGRCNDGALSATRPIELPAPS